MTDNQTTVAEENEATTTSTSNAEASTATGSDTKPLKTTESDPPVAAATEEAAAEGSTIAEPAATKAADADAPELAASDSKEPAAAEASPEPQPAANPEPSSTKVEAQADTAGESDSTATDKANIDKADTARVDNAKANSAKMDTQTAATAKVDTDKADTTKANAEKANTAKANTDKAEPAVAAVAVAGAVEAKSDTSNKVGDKALASDKPKGKSKAKSVKIKKSAKGTGPEPAHVQQFREAKESRELLKGKVIGWNNGGFHVVVNKITAFCPRSEMDTQRIDDPKSYVDQEFEFSVLRIQDRGRRIVVSRAKLMRKDAQQRAKKLRSELTVGATVTGRVDSIADFGAFVDLGGLRGLVHISEISRQRVGHPSDELTVGQEIEVKVIRMEENGKRISLSMKELLPDPWRDIKEKYPEGELFIGKVEQSSPAGAVIELEPGLTGWLPRSAMSLPQTASVPRAFPVGRDVKIQVGGVDMRRQRLTLSLEGKAVEGSKADLRDFQRQQSEGSLDSSFNAMAAAFAKVR